PCDRCFNDCVRNTNRVVLRCLRQRLIIVKSSVSPQSAFDSDDDPRFIEGHDAAVTLSNKNFVFRKRTDFDWPELTVELFVQHIGRFLFCGLPNRVHFSEGNHPCMAAGTKNPLSLTRGSEGGP